MKKITKISRYLIKIRSLFIVDGSMGDRARGKLYEPYLKSYGVNFKVASQAMIFNPNKLDVGNNVYIGFNSYIGEGDVTINDEVLIRLKTFHKPILAPSHPGLGTSSQLGKIGVCGLSRLKF